MNLYVPNQTRIAVDFLIGRLGLSAAGESCGSRTLRAVGWLAQMTRFLVADTRVRAVETKENLESSIANPSNSACSCVCGWRLCPRPPTASPAGEPPGPGSESHTRKSLACCSINIEALCAVPPEALAHSPSQMPLSCPVAPASQRELNRDGGGGGGGVAGGRTLPGPRRPSPAPRPVVRPPKRPTPRPSRARPSCVN